MNENKTVQQIYENEYIPYSIKIGRLTSLLGVVTSFVPVIVLSFIFKVVPPIDAIIAAATIRISACLVYYFIEPISFQPVLGIPWNLYGIFVRQYFQPPRALLVCGAEGSGSGGGYP